MWLGIFQSTEGLNTTKDGGKRNLLLIFLPELWHLIFSYPGSEIHIISSPGSEPSGLGPNYNTGFLGTPLCVPYSFCFSGKQLLIWVNTTAYHCWIDRCWFPCCLLSCWGCQSRCQGGHAIRNQPKTFTVPDFGLSEQRNGRTKTRLSVGFCLGDLSHLWWWTE